MHTHLIYFIYSSVDWRLGCFQVLAIVNNTAVNTEGQISLWHSYFIFFGHIPEVGLLGDLKWLFLTFFFFKNFHAVFRRADANLHSPQQCTRVLFSPPPHQHLLRPLAFLIVAILTGTRWCLIVILTCISVILVVLSTFVYLLAIWYFLWKNISI